jgi:lipoprotein-releasing system permease protein
MTSTMTATAEPADTRPFAPFEWMLAMRYLRARRKEGFISVIAGFSFIGIMLGVATLIIVMSVMNGFRKELFAKMLGLNGHAIVLKTTEAGPFDDYAAITQKIRTIPGITDVIPMIDAQALFSSPVQALGGYVRGIPASTFKSIPIVAGTTIDGIPVDFDGSEGIVVGTRLARALGVGLGDKITLISPRGAQTPFGTTPRSKPYTITGIFEIGMAEYDRTIVFMPLAEAQKFFSRGAEVDFLDIMTTDAETVDKTAAELVATLGRGFSISTWRQRNLTFFQVLEVERTVMFIILSLIVLVAALNIISGLMMLVKDKGRDIAVLRTMGATKEAMMRVFLITGAAIGVVGTLAGLVIGLIFCANIEAIRQFVQWISNRPVFDPTIYYLARLPAHVDPWETTLIVLMALALSVIATIYPSWRASKLDPVEALRYE